MFLNFFLEKNRIFKKYCKIRPNFRNINMEWELGRGPIKEFGIAVVKCNRKSRRCRVRGPFSDLASTSWATYLTPQDLHLLMCGIRIWDQMTAKVHVGGRFNWDLDLLMFLWISSWQEFLEWNSLLPAACAFVRDTLIFLLFQVPQLGLHPLGIKRRY